MFKKILAGLILTIALSFSMNLTASENFKNPYTLSVFGGAFLGNINGSFEIYPMPSTHDYDAEFGYNWSFGARINYDLNNLFYLNGGLAYKAIAGQYRVRQLSDNSLVDSNRFILNYLSIPVVIRMGKGFFLGAGGYLAYQLGSSKVENQKNGATIDLPDSWSNKLDYGMILEGGFVIKTPVELSLRLEYGFVNVIDKPQDTSYAVKMKNINLTFMLGIELDLFN